MSLVVNDPYSPKVVVDHQHNKGNEVAYSLPISMMKKVHAIYVSPRLLSILQPECDLRVETEPSLHNPSILASPGIVVHVGSRPQ